MKKLLQFPVLLSVLLMTHLQAQTLQNETSVENLDPPCTYSNPAPDVHEALWSINNPFQLGAFDIQLETNQNLFLQTLNVNLFTQQDDAVLFGNVVIYADFQGSINPTEIIDSETSIFPSSQTLIEDLGTLKLYDIEFDLGSIGLPGQVDAPTNYWISLTVETEDNGGGGDAWWEHNEDATVGTHLVRSNDGGNNWSGNANGGDFVYTVQGECELLNTEDYTAFPPLELYPNPVSSLLQVRSRQGEIETIKVFGLSGKEVMSFRPDAANNTLDLQALPQGMYLLVVTVGHRRISHSLLKQ